MLVCAVAAITVAAVTVPATADAMTVSGGSHVSGPGAVPRISQVSRVSLHAEFARLSGQVAVGREAGIVPPRAKTAASVTTAGGVTTTGSGAIKARHATGQAGSCAEPNCDLSSNGGPVQHNPKVYVVFWGPTWQSDAGEEASANYLLSFYQGLGTGSDTWSTVTSQYTDGSGAPAFTGSVFGGSIIDTSTPPAEVTQDDLAAEAVAADGSFGADPGNGQIIVASESGTCFADGFAGSSCTPVTGTYCAWHSNTSSSAGILSFTNLPYLLDAGASCGEDWINPVGTWDGLSTVGGHEYAESITDPQPFSGWIDLLDSVSGGEIGDKCAWGGSLWGGGDPAGDITLSTGAFAVQSLWDNASASCQMSATAIPPAATTMSTSLSGGGKTGTAISVPTGTAVTDAATLSGANAATATGIVTYDVYSDAVCSTLVNAGTAERITVPGTMPASSAVTLSTSGKYYWKASYSGDSKNAASASTCGASGEAETVTAPPTPVPAIDTVTSGLGKTTATVRVSTAAAGDLLVAYVAGKGPNGKSQSAALSATGLRWQLAARSDAGRGDAEVWYARASGKLSRLRVTVAEKYLGWPVEITVVAYKHATGVGGHATAHATKGAPVGSLRTARPGSWVFAVGDDWAKATPRVPGPGQWIVRQVTDKAGDTYWVQATIKVTRNAGTKVTISDVTPVKDPYNLVLIAVL